MSFRISGIAHLGLPQRRVEINLPPDEYDDWDEDRDEPYPPLFGEIETKNDEQFLEEGLSLGVILKRLKQIAQNRGHEKAGFLARRRQANDILISQRAEELAGDLEGKLKLRQKIVGRKKIIKIKGKKFLDEAVNFLDAMDLIVGLESQIKKLGGNHIGFQKAGENGNNLLLKKTRGILDMIVRSQTKKTLSLAEDMLDFLELIDLLEKVACEKQDVIVEVKLDRKKVKASLSTVALVILERLKERPGDIEAHNLGVKFLEKYAPELAGEDDEAPKVVVGFRAVTHSDQEFKIAAKKMI